jgi:hypothetical protein
MSPQQPRRRGGRSRRPGSGGSGGAGSGRAGQRRQEPVRDFWGDPGALPPAGRQVRISDDPSAVVRSLGTPPLPGQEAVAEHYFTVLYDRAVMRAGALAAAGGLIAVEELMEELGD